MRDMDQGLDIASEGTVGPYRVAAWALAEPDDQTKGLRAVLSLAAAPASAPVREAAREISERHRVETVRRLAARVAATLGRVR